MAPSELRRRRLKTTSQDYDMWFITALIGAAVHCGDSRVSEPGRTTEIVFSISKQSDVTSFHVAQRTVFDDDALTVIRRCVKVSCNKFRLYICEIWSCASSNLQLVIII